MLSTVRQNKIDIKKPTELLNHIKMLLKSKYKNDTQKKSFNVK